MLQSKQGTPGMGMYVCICEGRLKDNELSLTKNCVQTQYNIFYHH